MIAVVSDLHIGDSRADGNLPSLFRTVEGLASPDSHLVVNGDAFDLALSMSMDGRHREFASVAGRHGRVTLVQGNHDWCLGKVGRTLFPSALFCRELALVVGGRGFRFLHGHQSDFVSNRLPWLNRLMIRLNHWFAGSTGIDLQRKLRATRLGQRILERQENRIVADGDWAEVVVAGHTHRPSVRRVGGRTYINTGDWVESAHRACLLVQDDGAFELAMLGG